MTFVHIAELDGEHNPLAELPGFRTFQEGIGERCDEPPPASALRAIGSFHLFDDRNGAA